MRTARDAIKRILHDPSLESSLFAVGYLDRFVGIIVRGLGDFDWSTDLGSLDFASSSEFGVPQHRVQFITFRGVVVWQKNSVSLECKRKGDEVKSMVRALEEMRANGARRTDLAVAAAAVDALREELCALKAQIVASNTEGRFDDIFGSTPGGRRIHAACAEIEARVAQPLPQPAPAPAPLGERAPPPRAAAPRPTHFICVRLSNPRLVRNVRAVQRRLCAAQGGERLRGACLAPSALHVTLLMLRLQSRAQLERARDAMAACASELQRLLPAEMPIGFRGLSTFGRGRLVYGVPEEQGASRLRALHAALRQRLPSSLLLDTRESYTPHATIAKLSRAMTRDGLSISDGSFDPRAALGVQRCHGLWLCRVAPPTVPTPDVAAAPPAVASALFRSLEEEGGGGGGGGGGGFYPVLGYLHNPSAVLDDPAFAPLYV